MLQSILRRFHQAGPDDVTPGGVSSSAPADRLGSPRAGSIPDNPLGTGPGGVAVPASAEFVGYALDCEIRALAPLEGVESVRWTDLLNAASEIDLREAVLIGLAGGEPRDVGDLTVARDELVAVWASTFRGSDVDRVRTRGARVTFTSGPYRIVGYLHAAPTADALGMFARRPVMVPLTEARLLIPRPRETRLPPRVVSGGTLIVNRTLIHDLQPWHEAVEYPAMAARLAELIPIRDIAERSLVA